MASDGLERRSEHKYSECSTRIESATTNGCFTGPVRKKCPENTRRVYANCWPRFRGTMGLPFYLPFLSNKRRQVEATGGRGLNRIFARSGTKRVRFPQQQACPVQSSANATWSGYEPGGSQVRKKEGGKHKSP